MKTSDSLVRIFAPASKVWKALTVPELVKQWQYGSDLLTTWEVGTPNHFS
ncbi:SRPBCC domain-containing protein [Xanthomonas axonopodis]|nr:SRPBCC domain-containing protein [Xanthomonas axonopodis]